MYIAMYECIISVILHNIFKMGYRLQNIKQCYLPLPNVICLEKWQITCTAMKKVITSRSSYLPPSFHTLTPTTTAIFDSLTSGFTSLSLKSTFCAVSGCFWLSKLSKKRKLADFVPLCCVFSLPLDNYWCYLTQLYLHSHI